MVPQYVFCYRDRMAKDIGVTFYVLSMGAYRCFYAANWIYKKVQSRHLACRVWKLSCSKRVNPTARERRSGGHVAESTCGSLSDYVKVRTVGRGSFGEALLVKHRTTGQLSVLKRVRLEVVGSGSDAVAAAESAAREAQVLHQLRHPHIVASTSFLPSSVSVEFLAAFVDSSRDSSGSTLCLLMAFFEGGDLQHRLQKVRQECRRLQEPPALRWFDELCSALAYVHQHHVLHRDLKPSNIFLTGRSKLAKQFAGSSLDKSNSCTLQELREIDLYEWEGLTQDEVRNKTPEQFRQWKDLSKKPDTSLRSSSQQEEAWKLCISEHFVVQDLWKRASQAWALMRKAAPEEKASLIVAHGTLGKALLATALGLPEQAFRHFAIKNGEVVEVAFPLMATSTSSTLAETKLARAGSGNFSLPAGAALPPQQKVISIQCGVCQSHVQVQVPLSAQPGTAIRAACPRCTAENDFTVPASGAFPGLGGFGLPGGLVDPSMLQDAPGINDELLYVACEMGNRAVEMMVDTGAQSSVISMPLVRTLGLESRLDSRYQGRVACFERWLLPHKTTRLAHVGTSRDTTRLRY
eukprot:g22753.t1